MVRIGRGCPRPVTQAELDRAAEGLERRANEAARQREALERRHAGAFSSCS